MLVEHTFVTTLPFESVREQTADFLRGLGFSVTTTCWKCNQEIGGALLAGTEACPACASPLVRQMPDGASPHAAIVGVRGKETPFNVRHTDDLPQRVRLEFDRGRCTVAASILEQRKVETVHRQMVMALANGLEWLLVKGDERSGFVAYSDARRDAARYDADRRRRVRMGCLIAMIIVGAILALIIVAAISSRP